jgi:hypothetical protein
MPSGRVSSISWRDSYLWLLGGYGGNSYGKFWILLLFVLFLKRRTGSQVTPMICGDTTWAQMFGPGCVELMLEFQVCEKKKKEHSFSRFLV